jgi:Holliday junction resolvase RusA-like endonuclease
VSVAVRVGGSRADADNLLKATIDALVNAGRIEDDRNVAKAIAEHDACLGTRIEIKAVKS